MNVEILLGQRKTNFRENITTSSKADKYRLAEKHNSVGNSTVKQNTIAFIWK